MKKDRLRGRVEAEFRFPKRYRVVPRERRHLAKPGETEPRNCKVRVSICLDADVIRSFKERAARPGAPPYQTQINAALREVIGHPRADGSTARDASILLSDRRFIEAVAKRVSERLA
jgi:uncharacterized protein (DUF4415 family)